MVDLPRTSFAGGLLDEALHGRFDLAKYDVGLRTARNVIVHVQGGVSNRPGTHHVGAVKDAAVASRLIPFQRSRALGYILELADGVLRILRDGAFVTSGGSPVEVVTPWAADEVASVRFSQSADVMYLAHPNHPPQKLSRISDTSWTLAPCGVDPSINPPSPAPVAVATAGSGSDTYVYKVAAVSGAGSISLPSDPSAAITNDLTTGSNYNTVTWTAVADAVEYRVYKQDDATGIFGYIGFTVDLTMDDKNISPDLTDTPVEASGLFAAAGEYPGAVELHKDRLGFAGSDTAPEVFWFSRVADYENQTTGRTVAAAGAITDTVTGPQVNRILHMVSTTQLLLLTEGGEWSVYGAQGLFVPGELTKDPFSAYGAGEVAPVRMGASVIFVDGSGRRVHEIEFFADSGFDQNELTLFAESLVRDTQVTGLASAAAPFKLIWACTADGRLLSMAFHKRHQVFAWSEHALGGDGVVESVCAVREASEDRLYMVVRRQVNGATVRYVERMASRRFGAIEDAMFLDSALSYQGAAATTFSGLDHLEGETVCALADGSVHRGLTVSGGAVTLPRAAETVHIGLPYTAQIEPMPVAISSPGRAARGRKMGPSGVRILFADSAMPEIQGSGGGDVWDRMKREDPVAGSTPPPLFSGILHQPLEQRRDRDGAVRIRQTDPLPLTILGMVPEVDIG